MADQVAPFLERFEELLKDERAAEIERTSLLLSNCSPRLLEKKGLAIGNLSIASVSIGLGGKSLIELERPLAHHTSQLFPPHSFRTGDIARLEENAASNKNNKKKVEDIRQRDAIEGVVYKVSDTKLTLAVESESREELDIPDPCRIVKLANSVTYDRMDKAVETLSYMFQVKHTSNPKQLPTVNGLHRVLLGLISLSPPDRNVEEPDWFDSSLNDSQREAVRFALSAPEVASIWGPPGTGKTHTLIEIILQLVSRGLRVLVCGASNLAVDNILERLAKLKHRSFKREIPALRPLRISNPARTFATLIPATLDYQVRNSEAAQLVRDCKEEIESKIAILTGKGGSTGKGKTRLSKQERRKGWEEVKELRKEYRKREAGVVRDIVKTANVVLATCHSAGSRELQAEKFDVLIIDEATQAMEPVCWIPIFKAAKLILAGDPMQLPPTVLSQKPGAPSSQSLPEGSLLRSTTGRLEPAESLSVTLFMRLKTMYGEEGQRMLQTQYRMNTKIVAFPAQTLYESKLETHESAKTRQLGSRTAEQDESDSTFQPLVFIDTAGMEYYERIDSEAGEGDEGSKSNENEANLVLRWVQKLMATGLNSDQITILTPYQAQVQLLCTLLRPQYPDLEIGTVDGMQGREQDVVILSLVRSNAKGEVGFLKDKRRLNVAMTRARMQLCVVGDSSTVKRGGAFLKSWMAWLDKEAELIYAGDEGWQ